MAQTTLDSYSDALIHHFAVTALLTLLKLWEGEVRRGQECDSGIVDTTESGLMLPSALVRCTGNVGGMECVRGDTTAEVRCEVMEDTEVEMGA